LRELAQASVSAWLPFNAAIYTVVPLRLRLPSAMIVHFFYAVGLALWEVGFFGARHDGHAPAAAAAAVAPPPEPLAGPGQPEEPRHGYGTGRRGNRRARRAVAVAAAAATAPGNRTAT
jgi:hypothetical protein